MHMVTQVLKRPQRWTAERQTEVVLSILRGETTVEAVAADFGFERAVVQGWRDRFLEGGARALRGEDEPAPARSAMGADKRVFADVSQAVGRTPLVRLNAVVAGFAGQAFAKLEHMNPMGSVKDRLGRHLVERAARDGRLQPGGTLVEASSGNTAMGLGMMAALRGYRCKVAVRDRTSKEKVDALRAIGVEVQVVDGSLPPDHPESYARVMERIVRETPGAYFPDQHNNRENNEAHYLSTGPELWEQMDGDIDIFVAGMGTGGTISGVARYLKERDPRVKVVAVDAQGSVFAEYFRTRRLGKPGPYLVEGLGDEGLCECVEWDLLDDVLTVPDGEAFRAARDLARKDAILVGGSSGAALWGVRELIRRLDGRPARIATLFPDGGGRYLSKIYNDEWMASKGFA
jgi:cystathionine beta-synthase